ncbi:MAG: hypothetical protein ACP5JG_05585 [Anaerolineae bacterium]
MIDLGYAYKGLCGLARAHHANTMAGHLGAALIAGYFVGEQHRDLDDAVYLAIEADLDRIVGGAESIWFDPEKAGITIGEMFKPFPREGAQPERIDIIPEALCANIDRTRQSGHNVIFTSIAVRAMHDHPGYATPAIVEGIRKLIEGFNGARPGRGYYGEERGWISGADASLPDDDALPPYESQQAMIDTVINEVIASASQHRRGFGGLFHIINHAAALTELGRYGYEDLARRGLAAHRQHLRLWRSLPVLDDKLGQLERASHDPRTPAYWRTASLQWSAHLTHRIKTLYGFHTLLHYIHDAAKRREAEAHFLYLMG